jgi:hypothetical protein
MAAFERPSAISDSTSRSRRVRSSRGSSTRRAAIARGDHLLNHHEVDDRGSIDDPLERLEQLVDTVTRAFSR